MATPREVQAIFLRINEALKARQSLLFADLGRAFVKDVQDRIKSGDGGRWATPSKWILAKKSVTKALVGAEKYIKYRVRANGLQIISEAPYSLNEHHKGFKNKLIGAKEKLVGGRLAINVINPGPLNLDKPRMFHWVPSRVGTTPARKIWPDTGEQAKIARPVFTRWVRNALKGVPGVNVS